MSQPVLLLLTPLPDFLQAELKATYRCISPTESAAFPEVRAVAGHGGTVLKEELICQLPQLEIVAINGVGYDGVEVEACRRRGISVTHTPDVLTEDVADIALALVLMTSRGLLRANRDLHAGRWEAGAGRLTRKVAGRRAGLVGLGRIGKAIADRLSAIGMEIAYHGRSQQAVEHRFFADLNAMAAWCDFLVLACPGGPATRHLVDASVLQALGPDGTLINVARGSVVDEKALIQALADGSLGGAGLDVFEQEPVVPAALMENENLVLLPHVGSATRETRQAMGRLVLDNLAAHFSGQPLKTLIPELRA